MKIAKIYINKTDDGKDKILVVKPSLYTRVFGRRIIIFLESIKRLQGGKAKCQIKKEQNSNA